MNLRVCVGASWMLVVIVGLALWPHSEEALVPDPCDDASRLERIDPGPLRGDARFLLCPAHDAGQSRAGIGPPRTRAPSGEAALLLGRRIDLNTATVDELRALPGIGPGLARRIVEHREEAGPFDSLDALSGVKGFGPGRLGAMRGWAVAGEREVGRR